MENELKNLTVQDKLSYEEIKRLIYTIRGKQVMLDCDVAMLYHYTTKNINKAVKRNIDRFPEDFCFQLMKDEMDKMWFQNGTTSKGSNNIIKNLHQPIYNHNQYRTWTRNLTPNRYIFPPNDNIIPPITYEINKLTSKVEENFIKKWLTISIKSGYNEYNRNRYLISIYS